MTSAELLADAFGRLQSLTRRALEGASQEALGARPDPDANSIAWLIWHLSRIQDDHLAVAIGCEQRWTAGGWCERFGLPFEAADTGHGHDSGAVGELALVPGELLLGYHEAVITMSLDFVSQLGEGDLDRIVDVSYDPPVTLGVRLVSVLSDNLQHAGQALYVKGVLSRR